MQLSQGLILSFLLMTSACIQAQKDAGETKAVTASATLSKLAVNIDALSPAFDPQVNQYTLVAGETASNKMSINAAPVDAKVKIQVNGVALRDDFTTDILPLVAGTNTFALDLWRDGAKVNTYTITVQRVQDLQDQEIDGIATSEGDPSPGFSHDILNYEITVNKNTTVFTVSPAARYPELATVLVNGKSYPADIGSYDVDVKVGSTTIIMEIRGQSGRTKTYTLVVTRPAS